MAKDEVGVCTLSTWGDTEADIVGRERRRRKTTADRWADVTQTRQTLPRWQNV